MGPLVETVRALFGRLRLLVSFARVLRVDATTPLISYELEGFLGELRSRVPHVGTYGFQSVPPEGSQAVALAVGGDRGNMVVVGTEDRATRPALLDRETQIYTAGGPAFRATTTPTGSATSTQILGDSINVGSFSDPGTVALAGNSVTAISTSGNVALQSVNDDVTIVASAGTVTITASTVTINGVDFSAHTHTVPPGTDSGGGVTGVPQ